MRALFLSLILCVTSVVAQAADPVTASYRVELQSGKRAVQSQTWYIQREPQRITIYKPQMDDIWRRDQAGQISFERVFHDDRTIVEYTAGELRTLGVTPVWDELASIFDPAKLQKLKPLARTAGAASYQGKLGEEQVKVEWLDEPALPRSLLRSAHGKSVRFTLLKQPATLPDAIVAAHQALDHYTRLDASDFGDMEYNPVVKKAMHLDVQLGWRAEHEHGHD